jgi:hypothetical protein
VAVSPITEFSSIFFVQPTHEGLKNRLNITENQILGKNTRIYFIKLTSNTVFLNAGLDLSMYVGKIQAGSKNNLLLEWKTSNSSYTETKVQIHAFYISRLVSVALTSNSLFSSIIFIAAWV